MLFSRLGYEKNADGEKVRPSTENVFRIPEGFSIVDSNELSLRYFHDETKMTVHCASVEGLETNGCI